MEFNLRLIKSGGKILLHPDIVSYYYPKTDLTSFIKNSFRNGTWAIIPFKHSPVIPISIRHLVPLAFVASLGIVGMLSFLRLFPIWPFLTILGAYFISSLYFLIHISLKNKFRYIFVLPFLFAALHVSYGLGSLIGMIIVLFSKKFWINRLHQD